ncbi:MAG: ATP-dependent DNA helicase RecG [Anaerolineales bacterium]|nr:MAG: ATP-dependent DNA helicase RecG [Anaerolineales bacterium]
MQPSLSKLRKIFSLEAQRQYDNRAVIGGLEQMLPGWASEARAEDVNEPLVNAIVAQLRNYDTLEPEYRSVAINNVSARIERETGTNIAQRSGRVNTQSFQVRRAPVAKRETPTKKARQAKTAAAKEPAAAKKPTGARKRATKSPDPDDSPKPPVRRSKPPARRAKIEGEPAALEASTTVLTGVGPVNAERLEKLGIYTLGDMLYHFPRRYDDYSQLLPIRELKFGQVVTVIGTVKSKSRHGPPRGKQVFEIVVDDGTAALRAIWFNQPWLLKNFREGDEVVLSGKIDQYLGRLTLSSPEWELVEDEESPTDTQHTNRIVPVYPLTADIRQRWLRGLMKKVVSYWAPRLPDMLPPELLTSAGLLPYADALQQVHFPDSQEHLEAAKLRLAFNELFLLQLAVLIQKRIWQGETAQQFAPAAGWLEAQTARLPYTLTEAQQTALADLLADLASGRPMNRLLQGDVGSGKTVVAALCMALVAASGAQAAIMAPTSILAEQHYASLRKLLANEGGPLAPEEIRLMIGATSKAEKDQIKAGLSDGRIKLIIGTHTLIEDPVVFDALELIVIDEQHRFGVGQRAALRNKGTNPHLLVMSATPIPRSLALTLYGDLDVSVIDELPPGRQQVSTHVLPPREVERAYTYIRKEAAAGRQAFIIYPLIEESETSQAKAAVAEHARLSKEVFPQLKLGLLHGRISAEEKDQVMSAFRDGQTDVLVSTTVIEVGVDVPNATVMLIEGANRFGLAQLHQLRGRVGRGSDQAYCILVPDSADALENERLTALASTHDGFKLAEIDLQQRGPGQFMGMAQAGFGDLQLALLTDTRLIDKARRQAESLLAVDPELSQPQHTAIAAALIHYTRDGKGDLS